MENAVNIFVAAKRYRAETLAKGALDVIADNFSKVKNTEGWSQNSGPELFEMLAHSLTIKNQSKTSRGSPAGLIAFFFPF